MNEEFIALVFFTFILTIIGFIGFRVDRYVDNLYPRKIIIINREEIKSN